MASHREPLDNSGGANSLLLDLPVPFRRIDGVLHVEAQAHNGIQRWLDNFERVTVCAPCIPDALVDPSISWLPVDDLLDRGRLAARELPWGYHPLAHLRQRGRVRALYRDLVASHRFLCFANLGWAGGWGNIAASEAARASRPYAVWMDSVLQQMHPRGGGIAGAAREWLEEHHILSAIRGATLGLFHGQTVYDAYAPISRHPYVVHNIHLKRPDIMLRPALVARLDRTAGPVRIGYAGRVHEIKGPLQWIDAMQALARRHPGTFTATWLGDGPMLEPCRQAVASRGLGEVISFPGGQNDRGKVLEFLRSLDLFAFCHLTPESPRCLIEALMSGVPLVGYDSAYARELVAETGGGDFVPIGDVPALVDRLAHWLAEAPARREASLAALAAGEGFSDEAVFAHRSELIKRHLQDAPGQPAPAARH